MAIGAFEGLVASWVVTTAGADLGKTATSVWDAGGHGINFIGQTAHGIGKWWDGGMQYAKDSSAAMKSQFGLTLPQHINDGIRNFIQMPSPEATKAATETAKEVAKRLPQTMDYLTHQGPQHLYRAPGIRETVGGYVSGAASAFEHFVIENWKIFAGIGAAEGWRKLTSRGRSKVYIEAELPVKKSDKKSRARG